MHESRATPSRGRVSLAAAACALVALAPGCGDDIVCPSEIVVTIASPAEGAELAMLDVSSDPGVQIDVTVRSNLRRGDVITLDAVDSAGQVIASFEAAADADGGALFSAIDVPVNIALLRATAEIEDCGSASDEVAARLVTGSCPSATLVSPTGTVTSDKNGDPDDGVQVDVVVEVDPACGPVSVTTDCGVGSPSAQFTDGRATLEVTLCDEARCEETLQCSLTVTNVADMESSTAVMLRVDNLPPRVTLQLQSPRRVCGGSVTEADDVDGNAGNGVQIDVLVIAPFTTDQKITVDSGGAPVEFPSGAGGSTRVTLSVGANDMVGSAVDIAGNLGQSPVCTISLVDVAVNFDDPIADGLVGAGDGSVDGNGLTLDLCGTVSETGATIEVAIDGGAPQAAAVNGTSWCLTGVTLSEGVHAIDASAMVGVRQGSATLTLEVDLTPPADLAGLTAAVANRQAARLSWTATSDGGRATDSYLVKFSTTPFSEGNFATSGAEVDGPTPGAPGSAEEVVVNGLDAGTEYFFAVAALDGAGNRTAIVTAGPVSPDFDATAAGRSPDPGVVDDGLGTYMTRGDYNGDGFGDIALGVPYYGVDSMFGLGQVFVYFGGPNGIANVAAPNVIIRGTEPGGNFGQGLATLKWTGDGIDDLAVAAPFADNFNGRVFLFEGGAGFAGISTPGDAAVTIGVNAADTTNWLYGGFLGWSLAAARFDSDAQDDLVMASIGGNNTGGLVVLYGGATGTSILLSTVDASQSGDARALIIEDPEDDPTNTFTHGIFGNWIYNLGRTEGVADTDDDIGVAYFDNTSALVIRGRARPGSAGTTVVNFNPSRDLRIQHPTLGDEDVHVGSAMGSVPDINGDNARDIALGAWGETAANGRVYILDGNAVGTIDVSSAITTIGAAAGVRKFGTAIANNALAGIRPDVNGDGLEDLIIGGGQGTGAVQLFVWYGGSLPTGAVTSASAAHTITGPALFTAPNPGSVGTPVKAMWAGDVNNDGLEDVCWADLAQDRDGAFQVLWDDGL